MTFLPNLLARAGQKSAVQRMFQEAKDVQEERRSQGRVPYFQPVMLQIANSTELYSAFTRDISLTGMGLLHWMPLEQQLVTVNTQMSDGSPISIDVEILWCVDCGEGWYISGGRFADF